MCPTYAIAAAASWIFDRFPGFANDVYCRLPGWRFAAIRAGWRRSLRRLIRRPIAGRSLGGGGDTKDAGVFRDFLRTVTPLRTVAGHGALGDVPGDTQACQQSHNPTRRTARAGARQWASTGPAALFRVLPFGCPASVPMRDPGQAQAAGGLRRCGAGRRARVQNLPLGMHLSPRPYARWATRNLTHKSLEFKLTVAASNTSPTVSEQFGIDELAPRESRISGAR